MNPESVTATVIGDVALVVVVSWLLGTLARRCGQPTVIGQIIAGVVLGPTLLGRLPGDLTDRLFPADVRPFLSVLSQVAIVIFMFVAGYEIDSRMLRRGGHSAGIVALFALLIPMGLGAGAVQMFHGVFAAVDPHHVDARPFPLFMAVAVSISALPVLAAIVRERGIAGTRAGTVAMSAAGLMDVGAWLMLAAALTGTGSAPRRHWPVVLVLVAAFVLIMFLVVRPVLAWWLGRSGALLAERVPIALGLALGSAWVTASLGLHAVFGGFLAGLAMPRENGVPDERVLRPMEQSAELLLPLFFVATGLSFDIGSVDGDGVLLLAMILVIAVAGKLGPAYGVSRISGLDPRQSALVAALVNTRGLTELVALNVGLASGIINGELFAVLVLMALITTLMTGPLLSWIGLAEDVTCAEEADAAGHGV
ncbi:cation:proton antiporter [Actinoallomurus iriomotensis]|uniref:Integral membrane ion exchanger n=1 Tax=Actinoallomurus iriomotensis TaxID=478107 RepID=A0A9W6RU40_9ACTN|nr:cation:proton antiporter [Actinoallomurus iriomotensis]GLY81599.1 integral membrane ion exchanger [Actinoallomurus iriomotensis]